MAYLSDNQIQQMAVEAVTNYEFSCEWVKAAQAAKEFCVEEFNTVPRKSAVLLAVKQAQLMWMGHSIQAKAAQ